MMEKNSHSQMIRILLSEAASDALTAAGEEAFAVVHKSMRTIEAPEEAGRWILHLAPVPFSRAQEACDVLLGRRAAGPVLKKPSKATS